MNRDDASGSERQICGEKHRPGGSRFAALLLISALALTSGCGRRPSVGTGAPSGTLPDQEVRDFVLTETDQGALQWKLYARYAAIYDARNAIVARDVRVDFFDEKGVKSSELVAREGEINQMTRDMSATGDVVLQTTEGTRMSTQQLRFLNRTQKVVSEALVRVERGSDVLTGYGFESDPNLRHYEFKRRVSATVRTPSGGLGPGGGK